MQMSNSGIALTTRVGLESLSQKPSGYTFSTARHMCPPRVQIIIAYHVKDRIVVHKSVFRSFGHNVMFGSSEIRYKYQTFNTIRQVIYIILMILCTGSHTLNTITFLLGAAVVGSVLCIFPVATDKIVNISYYRKSHFALALVYLSSIFKQVVYNLYSVHQINLYILIASKTTCRLN